MIGDFATIGFVPSSDLERSRAFYVDTLGLRLTGSDDFAFSFDVAGQTLRVVAAGDFTPQPFTILGWEAPDVTAAVELLAARGVEFTRYPHFDQDELGIWTAPSGDRIAWFQDPDGNVLSFSQRGS